MSMRGHQRWARCSNPSKPAIRSQLVFSSVIHSGVMYYRETPGQVLWLVQHGQTTWDSMGWVEGHVDSARFTRKGRHEIRGAVEQLSEEPIVAVYSSDLLRSRRTAMAIARQVKCDVKPDRRLRERSFGIAEGVRWADVPVAVTGISSGCVFDDMACAPGGETLHDVYARCLRFLLDLSLEKHDGDVVIVAHDGSLRMLRAIVADGDLTGSEWHPRTTLGVERVVLPHPIPTKHASLPVEAASGAWDSNHSGRRSESTSASEWFADTATGEI
jgi:probable phosphoglycerate mutase